MIFQTLAETKIKLSLLEKIEFYTKLNYFKIERNNLMLSRSIQSRSSNVIKQIMASRDKLVKQINFMFLDDFEIGWTFIVIADKQSPMIIINENSITEHFKKNIKRYDGKNDVRFKAMIFALSLYLLGISVLVDCFAKPSLETSAMVWDFGNEVSNKILEFKANIQNEFSIYKRILDPNISKIFSFDTKYAFSVLHALKDEKINKFQACELLDFDSYEKFDNFFKQYDKTSELALLEYRMANANS